MKRPARVLPVVVALVLASVVAWAGSLASATAATPTVRWWKVSIGSNHTCALRNEGSLWCWGYPGGGVVGGSSTPARVGAATSWFDVQAGHNSSCALKRDHSLWCWGSGRGGELGTGDLDDRSLPTQVGQDRDWATVSLFYYHVCATKLDGSLWCWGDRAGLGTGVDADVLSPARVGTQTWSTVSVGYAFTCGVRTDGALLCWGANDYGQLGIGDNSPRTSPTRVGTADGWSSVSTGFNHACALRADLELFCWGGGLAVGDGSGEQRSSPVAVGAGTNWTEVEVGASHACARDVHQTLWCWGFNANGQLGIGTRATALLPVSIAKPATWAAWTPFSAGWNGTCAINPVGRLWCWGEGSTGNLGDGTRTDRTRPTRVPLPTT
jgi:alpha-tubulin suppressor-like RCC1 family protein